MRRAGESFAENWAPSEASTSSSDRNGSEYLGDHGVWCGRGDGGEGFERELVGTDQGVIDVIPPSMATLAEINLDRNPKREIIM